MKQTFTREFMAANCGCYDSNRLAQCSFMKGTGDISLSDIVSSEISIKDKYWFVCHKAATKEENQEIVCSVAEIVLPIYEKRYPENKAPREAIEAARSYIAGHISLEVLIAKRRDADYADVYAYAAAADDDVYAAAAYAAAYAAAAAAYAAAAAADDDAAAYAAAYAAAADDANIKHQLQDYLNTFILITELS